MHALCRSRKSIHSLCVRIIWAATCRLLLACSWRWRSSQPFYWPRAGTNIVLFFFLRLNFARHMPALKTKRGIYSTFYSKHLWKSSGQNMLILSERGAHKWCSIAINVMLSRNWTVVGNNFKPGCSSYGHSYATATCPADLDDSLGCRVVTHVIGIKRAAGRMTWSTQWVILSGAMFLRGADGCSSGSCSHALLCYIWPNMKCNHASAWLRYWLHHLMLSSEI